MILTLKGSGTPIQLNKRQFIAQGGEKSVYAKGNTAYAIYDDPSKMIANAKIGELAVLDDPNIITPDVVLLDNNLKPVGYTMRFVKDTYALCQLFTKSFKVRNNVSPDQMVHLVHALQKMISYVHKNGVIIVDLNEMNFLTDQNLKEVYAIDTNSYQTKSFPATVIMDSVRDRHSKTFSEGTDWFSFGVLATQMLVGIHPYKGSYDPFKSMAKCDRFEKRMMDNISIFRDEVKVPAVCSPVDSIPQNLKAWLAAVLDQGQRCEPPADYEAALAVIAANIKQISGTDLFSITKLKSFDDDIIRVCSTDSASAVITESGFVYNGQLHGLPDPSAKIAFSPTSDRPVAFWLEGENVKVMDIMIQEMLPYSVAGDAIMECNGRVYVKNGTYITEQCLKDFGPKTAVLPRQVGQVLDLPGATRLFDGAILQNMIGVYHISVFPETCRCYQTRIDELKGYKVIDARYENSVFVVIASKNGQYDRFVFRFDKDEYDVRIAENISQLDLNFTVADQGICALMTDEEKLEVFHNKIGSSGVKVIDDEVLDSDMRLYHRGSQILFSKGKYLYQIKMK